jgi:hypothetical protein
LQRAFAPFERQRKELVIRELAEINHPLILPKRPGTASTAAQPPLRLTGRVDTGVMNSSWRAAVGTAWISTYVTPLPPKASCRANARATAPVWRSK